MLRGEYEGEIFSAIFEAIAVKVDKERRGVGMQNFRYLPSLKDLSYTIRMASPSAYEILRKVIPMEHQRTIRSVLLFMIRPPLTINRPTEQLKANERSFPSNRASVRIYWFATTWTQSTTLGQLVSAVMIRSYLLPSVHIGMPKRRHTMSLDALVHHYGLRTLKSSSISSNKDTWRKQPRRVLTFTTSLPGRLISL